MHNSMPPVHVMRLPNFPETNQLPEYKTAGAAGMDVQAAVSAQIARGASLAVPTGVAFAVPDGYEMQVRSRSGLAAKHAVFVTNGIGTIDCDYRGELFVLLTNAGPEDFIIQAGDRIAQLVFAPTFRPLVVPVSALGDTDRGSGGLGSTGRR